MPAPKLNITDKNMLLVMQALKADKNIKNNAFCEKIKLPPQNIREIKAGVKHFSGEKIRLCCKYFGIDANFIVGLSKEMYKQ